MRRAGIALLCLVCSLYGCTAAVLRSAPIADLSATSWRVIAVNGRPTPSTGDYAIRFEQSGGVGARFGCNAMGGRYRMSGDRLTVSDLASTLMGCPEPAATFEREGAAILSQPMQVSFTSNERMGLTNEAGSITLDPAP